MCLKSMRDGLGTTEARIAKMVVMARKSRRGKAIMALRLMSPWTLTRHHDGISLCSLFKLELEGVRSCRLPQQGEMVPLPQLLTPLPVPPLSP